MWMNWQEANVNQTIGTHILLLLIQLQPVAPINPRDSNVTRKYSQSDKVKERRKSVHEHNHDTIGMIVVDRNGNIACGTTTNGLNHKIPGRVGDSPIAGAGCYVERGVGGAAATGDGDVMMRFLPSYRVVASMKSGVSPTEAIQQALSEISSYYPNYSGAMVAVNVAGEYGGAGYGFSSFKYTVYNPTLGNSTVITA